MRLFKPTLGVVVAAVLAVTFPVSQVGASGASPLSSKLLTIHQMPKGWYEVTTGPPSSLGCLTLGKLLYSKAFKHANSEFQDGVAPNLKETLVYTKSSKNMLSTIEKSLRGCTSESGMLSNGYHASITQDVMSFPHYGNQSAAYSGQAIVGATTLVDDFVLVREGPYLMYVQLLNFSPDVTMLNNFTRLALARLG